MIRWFLPSAAFVVVSFLVLIWCQNSSEKIVLPVLQPVGNALQRFVEQGQIAGAVALVAHGGKVVYLGAVGLADIEVAKQMQSFKMFSIAWMNKPITSTALTILQNEEKLSDDDKVVDIFLNSKCKN